MILKSFKQRQSVVTPVFFRSLVFWAFLVLQSCAFTQKQYPAFDANNQDSGTVNIVNKEIESQGKEASANNLPVVVDAPSPKTRIIETPSIEGKQGVIVNSDISSIDLELSGEPIQVNYNNLPIAAFINEVFGDQLELSYTIDPELSKQADLVTLRINGLTDRQELFRIAQSTLKTYGVVIEQRDSLLTFTIDANGSGGDVPLLVSGRALPDIPDSLRPIFMFVPLEVVSNTRVRSWLSSALKGQNIQVREDPIRNAIVLQGRQSILKQALSIIDFLDQPLMRGKYSISIEPVFLLVDDLAKNLEQVLLAEGYSVSTNPATGNIVLLKMRGTGNLVVFAPNQQVIDHVIEWAETIDQRQQLSIDNGIFSYLVANVRAEHIVSILNQLEGSGKSNGTDSLQSSLSSSQGVQDSNAVLNSSSISGRFVVDENRNAIVFKGSGQEWVDILPVIRDMDKPAPSVLVEILIAEVTLGDQEVSGVQWLSNSSVDIGGKTYTTNYGTGGEGDGGLPLGGSGFNLALNSAGGTRAALNAFYENRRAEIRSRPRLMVKSGQTASIEVGNEIPTVSSESRSVESPDAPIVQTVQYRTTGLTLSVSPIVHSSGYIDIDIEQSLSETSVTDATNVSSPTIFNRQISTSVTLRDGGSILLGGLVSSSGGNTQQGVPVLGKIPLIGKLFRTDSETQDRTELMILVMPFVLRNPQEAAELRKELAPQYNLQKRR